MALIVDVVPRSEYWYPDGGGQVWLEGYAIVDADGRYVGRGDSGLAARGVHVAQVAGAAQHHAAALQAATVVPGGALELRRDAGNAYDASAIRVHAPGADEQLGWVPRDLAAVIAPDLDAGRPWTALVLREQRSSPRDPRTGITMLLAPEPITLEVAGG
jgi:hypothetical protein